MSFSLFDTNGWLGIVPLPPPPTWAGASGGGTRDQSRRGQGGGVGSAFSAFELGLTAFAGQDLQGFGGADDNSCLGERRLLGAGAVELEGTLQGDVQLLLEPEDRPLDLLVHGTADGHELTFPVVGSMAGIVLSGGGPTRFVRPCAPGGLKRLAEICKWGRRR